MASGNPPNGDEPNPRRPNSLANDLYDCVKVSIDFERIAEIAMSGLAQFFQEEGRPDERAADGRRQGATVATDQLPAEPIGAAGGENGEGEDDVDTGVAMGPSQSLSEERNRAVPGMQQILDLVYRVGRDIYRRHGEEMRNMVRSLGNMEYESFQQLARGLLLNFSWSKFIVLLVFGFIWAMWYHGTGVARIISKVAGFLRQFFVDYVWDFFQSAGGWRGLLNAFPSTGAVVAAGPQSTMQTVGVILIAVGVCAWVIGRFLPSQ